MKGQRIGAEKLNKLHHRCSCCAKIQDPCSNHGLQRWNWWEQPVLMFEAGESWTLILPALHKPEKSVSESRGWCFLLAVQSAPGTTAWRQEKWPCITLHLEWEAVWHQPCNLRVCLLHAMVPAILLISCCVFPALSMDAASPVPILPRMPNAKLCHADISKPLFLVDETRMIFNRIMV